MNEAIEKRYRTGKRLVMIPLILYVAGIVFFILGSFFESPTDSGILYTGCFAIAYGIMVLCPIPAIIASAIGMSMMRAVRKAGKSTTPVTFMGITDILVSLASLVIIISMIWLVATI